MDYTSYQLGYDKTDPVSIEKYGRKLIGKTFSDVCDQYEKTKTNEIHETREYESAHEDTRRKGGLGELIEEMYFHYQANDEARADFEEAGVELKVTPYKKNKDGSLSAKERLVLTMIDYFNVINESFEDSHMWAKSRLILLIYYLYKAGISRLNYRIDYVQLFTPPAQDVAIIKHDFEMIRDKIEAGKAHELSESDTLYLGAVTKSANSKVTRKQPNSDIPAKPRAFAFKSSYMTYVLNNYIVPGKSTYESIVKGETTESFEGYVVNKVNRYHNYTVHELCEEFGVKYSKSSKALGATLAYRILGIKGDHAEEFEKADIVVKTMRITKNNKIKESMSFPTFKFKELVKENWEDSTFGNYLRETRFLFVVYKYDDKNELRLKGCQFWNIPYADLEGNVKKVWTETKKDLTDGLKITAKNGRHYSNLPKATDNPVCHVRPHGRNAQDTDELPDGRQYPKQCFWLNNSYILKQLNPSFFKD